MIHFLSNHKDASVIESLTGEPCTLIPHPYIGPEWDTNDVIQKCARVIKQAVECDLLVLNGDYTLVSLIVLCRLDADKKTGFLAMKKISELSSEKDAEGNIVYVDFLQPVGIRWVP